MNLGIVTYGRCFTLTDPNNQSLYAPATAGLPGPYTNQSGFLGYNEVRRTYYFAKILQKFSTLLIDFNLRHKSITFTTVTSIWRNSIYVCMESFLVIIRMILIATYFIVYIPFKHNFHFHKIIFWAVSSSLWEAAAFNAMLICWCADSVLIFSFEKQHSNTFF